MDSDAHADSESHGSHGSHVGRSGHVGHVGTTVTAVTVVTADTSASDPAQRRRPDARKVSKFQHRCGILKDASNQVERGIKKRTSHTRLLRAAPSVKRRGLSLAL